MPLSTEYVFEQDPPRRPALDDLHDGQIQNSTRKPPSVGHPDARAMNQSDRLVVAMAALGAVAALRCTITAGVPSLELVACVRSDMDASDFTPTDNAAGDTSVVHTGGLLPSKTLNPIVWQIDDVEIDRLRAYPIANGFRVKSKLVAVATDCNWEALIFGI